MEPVKCFMVERVEGDPSPARWQRVDTGEILGHNRDLPPGAMWEAPWYSPTVMGINGTEQVIVVRLPNGHDWVPGSIASNCPHAKTHWVDHDCWCVHGEPPELTVDKQPVEGRETCTAGAGSIGSAEGTDHYWHGFLRDGFLTE